MKKKKRAKKPRVTELPTEQAIEQLFPKEIVEELRATAAANDDENEEPASIKKKD
jgi:hypothetical protein